MKLSSLLYQSASMRVFTRFRVAASTPFLATLPISSSIAASTASALAPGLYRQNTVNRVGPSNSHGPLRPYSASTLSASSRPLTRPWYRIEASPSASRSPSTTIGAWSRLPRAGIFQAAAMAGTWARASLCSLRFSAVLSGSLTSAGAGVGRLAMPPKYFLASANPCAGVTSPAIASTALLGP